MRKAWVWVLIAAALFVTWLILVAPHMQPLFLQAA